MAASAVLPTYSQPVVGSNGLATPAFYRFFAALGNASAQTSGLQSQIDVINQEIAGFGGGFQVRGVESIAQSGASVPGGVVMLSLMGDVGTAGNTQYYGSDQSGNKGWYPVASTLSGSANVILTSASNGVTTFDLSKPANSGAGTLQAVTVDAYGRITGTRAATITGTAGRVTVADGDASAGLPTIDLDAVPDAGGGALLRFVRDAWGRLSGTSAATTSDLAEGSNLYFTAARVLATVLAGLSTATSAVITAADTVLSSLGKLQAQITANVTTLGTKADKTTTISAGVGLTGGGDLSANRTVSMGAPSTLTGATANSATGTTHTHALTLVKADVGLGNVDNTSDVNKPVSTAQAASIALKADDTSVVHLAGIETITGVKTFTGLPGVSLQCLSNTATDSTNLNCFKARIGPSALQSGDRISGFFYAGYNGASYVNGAAIETYTTEAWSGTASGTSFRFATTTNGTTGRANRWELTNPGHWQPFADNVYNIGSGSLRCAVIYAGTGTINTSDAREKTAVTPLTANELSAARDLASFIGTYQWLAAIQSKGEGVARQHVGLTVQQAVAVMQANGLDPMAYGFICYDTWPETPEVIETWEAQSEVLDEQGAMLRPAVDAGSRVVQPYRAAGDRYSFRPDELLLFMARGFDARLSALEAKA